MTYGTADTRPSPIVKKIFFTETQHIIQDIKDGSGRLGIGLTGSGSSKGMAALEGFATILDVRWSLPYLVLCRSDMSTDVRPAKESGTEGYPSCAHRCFPSRQLTASMLESVATTGLPHLGALAC